MQRPIAEKIAAQLMEALPKGTPAPALAQAKNSTTSALYALKFPSQQTSIITGQLGIDRQNSEYFPLMVGNYLLGQLPMASELFEHVRNQGGLAYGASSGFVLMSYRGPFMISLQTRTAKKTTALKITQEVLQKFVTQGPEPEKLQLTRQYIINHFPLTLATNSQITSVLTQMAINERPLDYLDTYQDKVNAVTARRGQAGVSGDGKARSITHCHCRSVNAIGANNWRRVAEPANLFSGYSRTAAHAGPDKRNLI